MKQTQLNFLFQFIFDEEFKGRILDAVRQHRLAPSKTKWRYGHNATPDIPKLLECFEGDEETIWILFRTKDDIEIRSVVPLELDEELSDDITIAFDKMPVGIQKAIAVSIPSDADVRVRWELYNLPAEEETSIHYNDGFKTYTQERVSAKRVKRQYDK